MTRCRPGHYVSVNDPFELQRFVDAQDAGGAYASAVSELRDGRKLSHWMWFVFPQIAGLGRSPTSAQAGDLREDEPHPVAQLSAVPELTHRTGVSPAGVLGVHKPLKLEGIVHTYIVAQAAPVRPARHRASYCVMSGAGLTCVLHSTAPFVCVRLHGPSQDWLYGGSYSDDDLAWWADRFREWEGAGQEVYAYFN